jgi:2-hydroxychromene-2-carboxylate isomerase
MINGHTAKRTLRDDHAPTGAARMDHMTRVTFYFDLGSPFAYLAAERIDQVLGESAVWQPVSLGGLFKLTGRSSWSLGDPVQRQARMAEVERRAQLYGLPPIRWPDPWPSNYLFAMRVAMYAFQQGRGREFTLRAFRHAFQDGNDLAISKHVLQVAADAGLDPQEAEEATQDAEVKLALHATTDAAHTRGVFGVPTVAVGDELFWGDDRLDDAARRRSSA